MAVLRKLRLAVAGAAGLALVSCSGPQSLYERVADIQRQRTANVIFACELAGDPCQYRGLAIDTGYSGAPGVQGNSGNTGYTGAQGATGSQGTLGTVEVNPAR